MKRMKKIASLLLAVIMVLGMSVTAFATSPSGSGDSNTHSIEITSKNQSLDHVYKAYKIFSGKLDATENRLSDIEWGDGIDFDALVNELKNSNEASLAAIKTTLNEEGVQNTAREVAKWISENGNNASVVNAFASIVAKNVKKASGVSFAGPVKSVEAEETIYKYTAEVTGEGYYFIMDETENEEIGNDSRSKYLLSVVKDVSITAKDVPDLKPEKSIKNDQEKVKEGTAAIGDEVEFVVDITAPDTTNFVKNFVFVMNDKLPVGMTFKNINGITIGGQQYTDYELKMKHQHTTDCYSDGTLSCNKEETYENYVAKDDDYDYVNATGGQEIKVVFKGFKEYVEKNNKIGSTISITYTAVVNKDAVYTSTGNKNEVVFKYSNDPNHEYDGDDFNENDPSGTTPKSETTTYVAELQIYKYTKSSTSNQNPLAGAVFEIHGENVYNMALVKGEKYVLAEDVKDDDVTVNVENGTAKKYWKLKDGSYTAQNPEDNGINKAKYEDGFSVYNLVQYENIVKEPEEDVKFTLVSGTDGMIKVGGLKPGTYTVTEVSAPEGYNKIGDSYTLVIEWDTENKCLKKGTSTSEGWVQAADGSYSYKVEILNQSGSLLPSTGGIGTTIFYVVGAILVIGAGVLLVAKKRMSNR